ncbi:hypothetical protein [Streptomyces sp. NPDC049915]|uniref:hypothetical protein n=1 Tax=Streptomyces sp. NPDC049915 TaxID=3155510 RepID=UPI003431C4E7
MKTLSRVLAPALLALSLGGLAVPAASAAPASVPVVQAADDAGLVAGRDCRAGDNLDEIAAKFISRCKKGSIRREFPSDRLSRSLGQIYDGKQRGDRDDVKAWKLLNDRRFDK